MQSFLTLSGTLVFISVSYYNFLFASMSVFFATLFLESWYSSQLFFIILMFTFYVTIQYKTLRAKNSVLNKMVNNRASVKLAVLYSYGLIVCVLGCVCNKEEFCYT